MKIEEAQKKVDDWIKLNGVRYFNELTNTALLMEEIGELSRHIARKYGEQNYKKECDRELSQIVGTYLQQQRYHYHSFIVDDEMDCSMFIRELQSTMDFYKTAIERFEKEYNRSYRQVKYYLSFEN
ncbi:MAG: hypothetical protein CBC73_00510 [Flavobacteriales bacterium TMED113]|nr:MAG: hypothetical protein CBC73_00510 [Flavobacteriales bacterium TMED113]